MSTVVVPVAAAKTPGIGASVTGASVTSSDTGTIIPGRGLVLALLNASTATTATIAGVNSKNLVVTVAASKTTYVKLGDSYYYENADGTIHFTVAATLTCSAITR